MTTTIFVYGTLKRGFPNHALYMGDAQFFGDVRTCEHFPLVIGGRWRSPYLIDEPGSGHRVAGEAFLVNAATLARLDELEAVHLASGYHRATVAVEPLAGGPAFEALAYLKRRATIETITEILTDAYPLDPLYVPAAARASARNRAEDV